MKIMKECGNNGIFETDALGGGRKTGNLFGVALWLLVIQALNTGDHAYVHGNSTVTE